MAKEKDQGRRPVIRQVTVVRYTGLTRAAGLLGVSATQVRRHVSGTGFSRALERKMAALGIAVER